MKDVVQPTDHQHSPAAEEAPIAVAFDLPGELRDLVGPADDLAVRARRLLLLDLLREGEISQGKTARLLGITRWDLLELVARYRIPSGPRTAAEMRQDIENALRYAGDARADAGD
jgi:predicted HTH domain antitoxin